MTMAAIGFLSLPAELIYHILFLLAPRDLCRCVTACKTLRNAAQNSIHIQYKLELYAQGFTETGSLNSISVDRKMSSLKRSVALWRSVFYASTVFEDAVFPISNYSPGIQYMKCGIWWMCDNDNLFIRDYNTDVKHSHSFPRLGHEQSSPRPVRSTVLDPIQDLVVVVPFPAICIVAGAEQNRHIFSVEFRLASSLVPHPDSVDAFLKCRHSFEKSGLYYVNLMQEPVICGDRIVVLYYTSDAVGSSLFMQVISWKKGQAQSYPFREDITGFHLVDEQKFVVIDTQGVITLYTLQEHGSPQRRAMYRLQECVRAPFYQFHATPSFHGATTCPDLESGYLPSLESQIIVLETLTNAWPVILVIDMVIFSGKALHSETPTEIPWSEWGPQYTCCFRHNSSCQISVFGSKIAYALPRYAIPRALPLDLALEGLCTDTCFYVHILDFNQRVIARAENIYDPDTPTRFIRKPSDHYHGPIISNRPYIATVCRTQFSPYCFARLFLEHDRLTLTWLRDNAVHIQVVSPVQMDVNSDLVH